MQHGPNNGDEHADAWPREDRWIRSNSVQRIQGLVDEEEGEGKRESSMGRTTMERERETGREGGVREGERREGSRGRRPLEKKGRHNRQSKASKVTKLHLRSSSPSSPPSSSPPASSSPSAPPPLPPPLLPASLSPFHLSVTNKILKHHINNRDHCKVYPEAADVVQRAMEKVDHLLQAKDGWDLPEGEDKFIRDSGGFPTYGELLPEGIDALMHLFGLQPDSVMYDLGCGTGRALLQVAMAAKVDKLVGVELSPTRLDYATLALEQLRPQLTRQAKGGVTAPDCIHFREENIAEANLQDATHVFTSSVCFDDALLRRIAASLAKAPSFQVLVSLRSLPLQPYLQSLGRCTLPCTFNGAQKAYVYGPHQIHKAPAATLAYFFAHDGVAFIPPHLEDGLETIQIPEL